VIGLCRPGYKQSVALTHRNAGVARTATSTAREAANSGTIDRAARIGLAARAVLYVLIGLLAILLAAGHPGSEPDQRGAMQQLNRDTAGHVLLWLIAVGLAGYALWRLCEATLRAHGDACKATSRVKSFARGCVYAVLSFSAFQVAVGKASGSQASQQATLSARVMHHDGGRLAVGIVGATVAVVGVGLIVEGERRKFAQDLDLGSMAPRTRQVVEVLRLVGTVARGAVFALAGVFVVQAAWEYRPAKAAGMDKALRALRDTPAGPWLLGTVALGLVAFGLYGFVEARWRRT
jgi:Domain of Unknown Function (DUF1206)